MVAFFKRHRTLVSSIAIVLAPLIVYRANREGTRANPLDRFVLVLTSPLEGLLSRSVSFVSGRWDRYVDVYHAREENIELRRKLGALEHRISQIDALMAENAELRGALDLRDRNPKLSFLSARVIATGNSPLLRMIRIDRGLVDHVDRGMPVIADAGLVGRIQRTSFGSSEVLLIADEKVSVDVMLARSRVRGRLTGAGRWPSYALRLVALRTDDIKAGDRVLTSGLGGVFPAGIPVGTVVKQEPSADDQQMEVEVAPYADFERLEYVQVVRAAETFREPLVTPDSLLPPSLRAGTSSPSPDFVGPPRPPENTAARRSESERGGATDVGAADAGAGKDAGTGRAVGAETRTADGGRID